MNIWQPWTLKEETKSRGWSPNLNASRDRRKPITYSHTPKRQKPPRDVTGWDPNSRFSFVRSCRNNTSSSKTWQTKIYRFISRVPGNFVRLKFKGPSPLKNQAKRRNLASLWAKSGNFEEIKVTLTNWQSYLILINMFYTCANKGEMLQKWKLLHNKQNSLK